jgi:hypothetical protein
MKGVVKEVLHHRDRRGRYKRRESAAVKWRQNDRAMKRADFPEPPVEPPVRSARYCAKS